MKTQQEKGHNGWTNYETWNVKLWIDNDEGSYNYWQEEAQDAYDKAESDDSNTKEENASFDLRERLKDYFENHIEEVLETAKCQASFVADLLHSSLSEVNWQEIAESLIEETDKE